MIPFNYSLCKAFVFSVLCFTCGFLPYRNETTDLITAFPVIRHIFGGFHFLEILLPEICRCIGLLKREMALLLFFACFVEHFSTLMRHRL